MVRKVAFAVGAGVLSLWPVFGAAQDRQFGNTVYTLPDGWYTGRDDEGHLVILSDLPNDRCEFCYIYISAGHPAEGTLADFLERHAFDFIDPDDRAGVTWEGTPEEIGLAGRDALIGLLRTGETEAMFVVAIDLGDRHELVGFEAHGFDLGELDDAFAVMSEQVVPMFEGLRFLSEGHPGLLPDPVPGDLAGIWWGTTVTWTVGIDGMMQSLILHDLFYFWPDGHFYHGTPPQGIRPLDRAALILQGDTNFGVWRRNGDRVGLVYATGEREDLRFVEGDLTYGSTPLLQVEPPPDGTLLDGTIDWFSFTGLGAGMVGGTAAGGETIFRPDGTYVGSSFGHSFGSGDYGGFSVGSDSESGGVYKVRDGLVVMRPDDGGPLRAESILIIDGEIMVGDLFLEPGP